MARSPRIVIALLAPVCLSSVARAGAQGLRGPRLTGVSGQTTIQRQGAARPLTAVRNMPLIPGDLISTGPNGWAQLLLKDGSSHELGSNALAQLLPPEAMPLDIIRGHYHGRPRPRSAPRTPNARINLHGTELDIVVDGSSTTLTVYEGAAEFENERGRVTVREGQTSSAKKDQAPTPPVAANLPLIFEWPSDLQPVVLLLERAYVSQDRSRVTAELRQTPLRPTTVEGWQRRGDLLHDAGDLLEARKAYETALGLVARDAAVSLASPTLLLVQHQQTTPILRPSEPPDSIRMISLKPAPAAEGRGAPPPEAPPPRLGPPERAALEARLGQTWLELGKMPEAETHFRLSLEQEPGLIEARTGRVLALLSRRRNDDALSQAEAAVATAPSSAEAHTARALVLIRTQRREEASAELAQAVALNKAYAPAYAWQSFLLRAEERGDEAEEAARQAVALAPHSSLARQSLSEALFALNRLPEARRQAALAVRLNPLSPGAHASLGRSLLQAGNLEAAVREAGLAVALDGDLPQARFLLGVALAQQRRLARAAAQLQQAAKLDPDYLEARAFLARVYLEQGRPDPADAEARKILAQHPKFAPAHAVLGRAYYEAGKLQEAEEAYKEAARLKPASLLYHLELARVYLDQNNLPDALAHGLEAVSRAPGSGEAHAVLGLIYDRRGSAEQARREYRAALSLAPGNALARLGLGTSNPNGDERVRQVRRALGGPPITFSVANTGESLREVAQAMLRDPSVLGRIFKPGVTTELAPAGGTRSTYGLGLTHRDRFAGGDWHDISFGNRDSSDNYRNGYPERRTFGWLNLLAAPNYKTHILGQYLHLGRDRALPGPVSDPTAADRSAFRNNAFDLSARVEVSPATSLWFHAASALSTSIDQTLDRQGHRFTLTPGGSRRTTVFSRTPYHQRGVEGRLDHRWTGAHATSYALYAGRNQLENQLLSFNTDAQEFEPARIFARDQLVAHTLEHDYHPAGRLSLVLGLRGERFTETFRIIGAGETVARGQPTVMTSWLPYGQATYVLTRRSLARATVLRRSGSGFDPLLPPADAFLVNAPEGAVEIGGKSTGYELDYEHRFSPSRFATLFLFRSDLRQLEVAPAVRQTLDPVSFSIPIARRRGVGLRYEQQLGRFLFGSLRYTYQHFVDDTSNARRGRQIPLQPRSRAAVGLNYIDRAGTKLIAEVDWHSSYLVASQQDEPWRRSPGRLVLNVRLGRERSVRREWFISLENLFNTRTFYWGPDFPAPGRALRLQYYLRF